MATRIFTIPSGTTQILSVPALSSVCFQPVAGGSATVGLGPDGVAPLFTNATQSGNTSPFSVCSTTQSALMGNIGKISVTAAGGQNTTVVVSDLSEYPGSFPERQTVAMSGVAYTMPNSTSELVLFSVRFPANYLQPNFRLTCEWQLTLTNNVNVKTLNTYFGPSITSATAGALEVAAAGKLTSNVYTSMIGAYGQVACAGRNDGQTVIGSNPGLLSTGGWGSSTTANVTVSSTNYNAGAAGVEQCFMLTGTKATGTDAFTLDAVLVKIYQ